MVMPRSASDAGAVAVEGRDSIPRKPLAWSSVVALESIDAARSFPVLDPVGALPMPCAVHVVPSSLVVDGPTDAFASKHADPDGAPAAPLPSEPFAEKSSDAEDG
jgi:hypothetical protein